MIILIHCIPYRNSIPLTYRLHINRNPTSVILSNPYVNTLSLPKVKYAFAPKRYNIDKTKCSLAIPV